MLIDEKPNNLIIYVESNDKAKFNCTRVNGEELAYRIKNISSKYRSYRVSAIEVSFVNAQGRE